MDKLNDLDNLIHEEEETKPIQEEIKPKEQEDIDKLLGIKVENSDKKSDSFSNDDPEPLGSVLDEIGNPNNYFDQDGNPNRDAIKDMDYDLVAEFGIELLDLGLGFGARAISGEWDNSNDRAYEISDRKKAQLRKPLQKILERKGTRVSPELLFGIMVIALYVPMYMDAYKTRKKREKAEQEKVKAKKQATKKPDHKPTINKVQDEKILTKEEAGIKSSTEVKWLKKHEAAKLAGVSEKTIFNWGTEGKIVRTLVKKDRVDEWYYSESSVKAYALKSRMRTTGSGPKPKKPLPNQLLNEL